MESGWVASVCAAALLLTTVTGGEDGHRRLRGGLQPQPHGRPYPPLVRPFTATRAGEDIPGFLTDNCMCVEYYQCDEDNYIITSATTDLVDLRLTKLLPPGSDCPDVQVCCRPPPPETPSSTTEAPQTPDLTDIFGTSAPDTEPPSIPDTEAPPVVPTVTPQPPPVVPDGTSTVDAVRGVPGCGVSRPMEVPVNSSWVRILDPDGGDTLPGEFPWMLAVLRRDTADDDGLNVFLCGASLVHPRAALTAAHCLIGVTSGEIVVRAGEWDTKSEQETLPFQEVGAVDIIYHPEFKRNSLFFDAALIVLEREFDAAENIGPVCIPSPGQSFAGKRCIATGWGRNAFGPTSQPVEVLRMVELPVVDPTQCQQRLRTTRLGPFYRLHNSFLCAGGEQGRDTCQGDGGGPLVCASDETPSRFAQAGIVSWGIGCGEDGLPAVYANVATLAQWIIDEMVKLGPWGTIP